MFYVPVDRTFESIQLICLWNWSKINSFSFGKLTHSKWSYNRSKLNWRPPTMTKTVVGSPLIQDRRLFLENALKRTTTVRKEVALRNTVPGLLWGHINARNISEMSPTTRAILHDLSNSNFVEMESLLLSYGCWSSNTSSIIVWLWKTLFYFKPWEMKQ